MYYGAGGHLRASSPPRRNEGIRIQRRTSNADPPANPPPVKPPVTDEAKYHSLSRGSRQNESGNNSANTTTSTAEIIISPEPPRSHVTSPNGVERRSRENTERRECRPREERAERKTDTDGEGEQQETRASYVEEPPSHEGTMRRPKSSALSRRVTNEMALAHYVHKVEINPEGGDSLSSGVYRCSGVIEQGLRRFGWYLGKSIANHNTLFTLLPLFLVVAVSFVAPILYRDQLSIAFPFQSLVPTSDYDVTSSGIGIRRPVVPQFNETNPAYAAIDRMNPYTYAVIMKNKDSKDTILRDDAIAAYSHVKHVIEGIGFGGKTWSELCGYSCDGEANIVDRIIRKSPQIALTYPETYVSLSRDDTNLTRLFLGTSIGGVDLDVDGAIASAQSLLASFQLKRELKREETSLWEKHFLHQVEQADTDESPLKLFRWSYAEFADTVMESLRRCHSWLLISAAVLFCCCFVSTLAGNAYQSKPLVGITTCIILCVSSFSALSVSVSDSGILNPLLFPVLFVLIGIGIAFCSTLHGAWAKFSSAALHPTEKIALIMAYEGTFVFACGLLLITMFLTAGFLSSTPFMQTAFLSIAVGVTAMMLLSFLLAVFIFKGGRRESKGCKWYHFCRSGDTHFPAPNLSEFDNSSLEALHDRLVDNKPTPSRQLAAWLVRPSLRIPLVVICTVYLIFALWGCANLKVELREEHFLPSQSEARKFLENFREMFGKNEEYLEITIEQSLDYHDASVRQSIIELIDEPVKDQYASRAVNWVADFSRFEKTSIYDINQDTFVPVVHLVFLNTEPYQRFASDITFDRFQTQITRSRMYLELTPRGVQKRKEVIDNLLSRARSSQLPITVKAPFVFSIQHDLQALSSAMLSFGVFLVVLLIVSLILFGQPSLTIVVVGTSFCVLIETVGYASHWGVPMNTVTLTMAICANSLSCVVALAFCYAYSNSGKGLRPAQRIQYTFQSCLVSLLLACSLPIITYVPLLSIDAPVITHIWRILLLSTAASFIHFLIFLPNILTFLNDNAWTAIESLFSGSDDESIYYIPTAGRIVPTEGIYQSFTYSIPKIQPPPSYLAIGPADPIYGRYEQSIYGRTRRVSGAESSMAGTPQCGGRHREPRQHREPSAEGIYEAPPSPRVRSAHSPTVSTRGGERVEGRRQQRHADSRQERIENSSAHWRQFLSDPPQQPYQYFPSQSFNNQGFYPR